MMRAALLLAAMLVSASGCAHVAPYDREYLAGTCMDTSRERGAMAFQSHVRDAREGATGGHGSTGGGCGCN